MKVKTFKCINRKCRWKFVKMRIKGHINEVTCFCGNKARVKLR